MGINGIGSVGYPATGYETRKTERDVAGGNFADAIKVATNKGTDTFRPESSDEVMQAWDQALAETGVNPFPMNRISTALVLHVESGQQSLSSAFLGDSIGSAKSMAEKIIHRLENPLTPAANPDFTRQELIFYKKFLEFLEGKDFTGGISKATTRLETEELDSGKAITKMRYAGDDIGKTSELEDKYCSLCGSMIKEDGSCPLCGVPTFISGNGRSGNQKIAQAASSHAVSGNPKVRMR